MGGHSSVRNALLVGGFIAATLVGASLAEAQQGPPVPVNFSDPQAALGETPALDLSVREDENQRFDTVNLAQDRDQPTPRRLELELAAGGGNSPVDVSVAQRASLGADENGDINRRGMGSELRVGRNLVERREGSQDPAVYMFVASDDEALTWQPGQRNEFGGSSSSLSLQERVEVGDMSAGVTYERNGVQASLAYVEREESTRVGNRSYTQDQAFTGLTVTMRR
jgi:hypothetical protein